MLALYGGVFWRAASPLLFRWIFIMGAAIHPEPISVTKDFEIPSIPLILIKIIQMLDENTSSAKELEELIRHDPALSARILRLANSAFYSFRARVKTIAHAITLLGTNLVTSLAIGINIFDSFDITFFHIF